MNDTLLKIVFAVSAIGLSVGANVLLYCCIRRYKRNRQNLKQQNSGKKGGGTRKLLIYWPLILVNAVPGFMITLAEQGEFSLDTEIWEIGMFVLLAVTLVVTFSQCGLRALWIGPLRWLIGLSVGILAGVSLICVLGILLVVLATTVRSYGESHIMVEFSDGTRRLDLDGQDGHWRDPTTGKKYVSYGDGEVIDEMGFTFKCRGV